MQIILNKKVAFLLYFTINVVHFIECSTDDQLKAVSSNNEPVADAVQPQVSSTQSVETLNNNQKSIEANTGRTMQYRASAFRGNQPNFRSSYVGNKLNRRNDDHTKAADVTVATTETAPLIKARRKLTDNFGDEIKYNVGPGVNIGVEKEKELVSVYLDEDCLKDVFTGRGRKQDLITKILPLFILPFLIQSAVVPFLVSTLKLLLIKSIVVGKIAIFLLLLSAFKNHVKYGYEAGPAFYPDVPNRRSEAHLTGYRVEGKPSTWIN